MKETAFVYNFYNERNGDNHLTKEKNKEKQKDLTSAEKNKNRLGMQKKARVGAQASQSHQKKQYEKRKAQPGEMIENPIAPVHKRTGKKSPKTGLGASQTKRSTQVHPIQRAETRMDSARSSAYREGKSLRRTKSAKKPQGTLRVMCLGGLMEIGKNMTVIEYEKDIVVVDCGLAFPDDEMLGVDLVIPDVSYLQQNADRVRGIFITHGHEDHIGAVPYVFPHVPAPAYGTKLTCALIRGKLAEHNLSGIRIKILFRSLFQGVKITRSLKITHRERENIRRVINLAHIQIDLMNSFIVCEKYIYFKIIWTLHIIDRFFDHIRNNLFYRKL